MAFNSNLLTRMFRPFTSGTASLTPNNSSAMSSGQTLTHSPTDGTALCTIAAGCFWGVEHMYRQHFPQLLDARVGYIGGDTSSPSYRSVCSGRTGHAEALQVRFDPAKVSYKALLEFFYKMHDPTSVNRQGPDTGSQYRSAIFYHDEEQEGVAKGVTDKVGKEWWKGKVATEVLPAGKWWDAEDYHQRYLEANPGGYECPSHFLRKFPPLSE